MVSGTRRAARPGRKEPNVKTSLRQNIRKTALLVSLLLFPLTMYYFSPVLVIQGAAAGIAAGSLVMFGLLFLSSLVAGRAFCGWLCPAGGLQEGCASIRSKTLKPGRRDLVKYVIWVPWIAAIVAAVASAGGLTSLQPLYQTEHGVSIGDPAKYVIYYGFIVMIVVLALTLGRRAFCRYVCWMAPFMVLGRRLRNAGGWPALRLVADTAACSQCGTCTRACPQSLDVRGHVARGTMEDPECILCGNCVDTCPSRTLRFSFSPGTRHSTAVPGSVRAAGAAASAPRPAAEADRLVDSTSAVVSDRAVA